MPIFLMQIDHGAMLHVCEPDHFANGAILIGGYPMNRILVHEVGVTPLVSYCLQHIQPVSMLVHPMHPIPRFRSDLQIFTIGIDDTVEDLLSHLTIQDITLKRERMVMDLQFRCAVGHRLCPDVEEVFSLWGMNTVAQLIEVLNIKAHEAISMNQRGLLALPSIFLE